MITDELREWVGRNLYYERRDELTAIADRIDAEHRKALEKVAAMVDAPDEKRSAYYDRFIAPMVDGQTVLDALEKRVGAIERKLNHRGER